VPLAFAGRTNARQLGLGGEGCSQLHKEGEIGMPDVNRTDLVSRVTALVAALANLSVADPMVLGGQKIAKADVIAVLNAFLTAAVARGAARLAFEQSLASERDALAKATALRKLLKSFLESRFGKSGPELASFGFTPAKVGVKTAEQKALAHLRNLATREARKTMGSQQKKAIKGNVPAAPAAPATPPKPAV
jgi:hypothetical protein